MTDEPDWDHEKTLRKWAEDNAKKLIAAQERNQWHKTFGDPPYTSFLQYPDIFNLIDCALVLPELVSEVWETRRQNAKLCEALEKIVENEHQYKMPWAANVARAALVEDE